MDQQSNKTVDSSRTYRGVSHPRMLNPHTGYPGAAYPRMSRRSFFKTAGLVVAGFALGTPLSACSAQSERMAPHVTCALNPDDEPSLGFDPLFGWGCGDTPHAPLIQSTLVTLDPEFNIVSDAAESWETSEDGLTLTFHLRQGILFSDGSDLTANDASFTIDQARQSDEVHVDLSAIASVEAPDDLTLLVHLSRPSNIALFSLCFIGIVPAATYDEISYGTAPIGSGPYMMTSWDRGAEIEFEANPHYYGNASMKRFTVLFQGEDEACGSCYNNRVDFAWTSPRLTDQSIDGFSLLDCSSVDCYGVSFPMAPDHNTRTLRNGNVVSCGNAVTQDSAIRRALCNGIDRKNLVKQSLQGYGVAAFTPVANSPWNNTDITITKVDTNQVKSDLDANGWIVGNDSIRVKNGQRAEFTLYCPSQTRNMRQPIPRQVANQFVKDARNLGIDVIPAYVDDQGMQTQRYAEPTLVEWSSGLPFELNRAYLSNSDVNFPGYSQGITDDYLMQADQAQSLDDAIDIWKRAQWDGRIGPCAQGSAAYGVLCTSDQVFYKRASLDVGIEGRHVTANGWSVLSNINTWVWHR